LVEKSQVGVYIVTERQVHLCKFPRFAEIFGYRPDELIGVDPVKSIISEEYQAISEKTCPCPL
jgi:PAS domain S-box-containing protein